MKVNEYQNEAMKTDVTNEAGLKGEGIPLLGLQGEIGSIANELKKYVRDRDEYTKFDDQLKEELGDIAWYCSKIASTLKIKLKEPTKSEGNFELRDGINTLFTIVSTLPELISSVDKDKSKVDEVLNDLVKVLSDMAYSANIKFEDVLTFNITKVRNRWAAKEILSRPAPCFDEGEYLEEEKLPRKGEVTFIQRRKGNKIITFMRMNNINIGDQLTDNTNISDEYRFHDIFHWTFSTILGWSPILRAILNCKRKSNPSVDESQDGARAKIIEEAISYIIFNYSKDHNDLRKPRRIDQSLLKTIHALTRGLEVEHVSPAEWEFAIIEAYKIFNKIRDNLDDSKIEQRFKLEFDANKRKIEIFA